MKDGISIRHLAGRRVRVTATRGAVSTEAVFTMAEVQELYRKLGKYLGYQPAPPGRVQTADLIAEIRDCGDDKLIVGGERRP